MKRVCIKDTDFCKSLIDGRYWLKNEKEIFIDFYHVNRFGNEIIAEKIKKIIEKNK